MRAPSGMSDGLFGRNTIPARRRVVQPEWLDELPATDARAVRSRRDLRRLNAWMGNARWIASLLKPAVLERRVRTVSDLGSGDGSLMLNIANRLSAAWSGVSLELVDQQKPLAPEVPGGFAAIGWEVRAIQADVFAWAAEAESVDLVLANLFLHHFNDTTLADLLRRISQKTTMVIACEPRRLRFVRLAVVGLALIGCSSVTRHDAAVSIRAGFVGRELSALWPDKDGWKLEEGEAGLGSHWFRAQKHG